MQILSIILIGIALSMDTFSLSLGVGTFGIDNKKALKLASIVGVMHFIMPFLGLKLGNKLITLLELKTDLLLGFILILIAVQMIIDLIKNKEEEFNLSFLGMIVFAIGVSIDSFSVGLGILAITNNIILAMIIFAICSFVFTYLGLILGRIANKINPKYASILGIIILLILGIVHII